jgi:hypothetical protein
MMPRTALLLALGLTAGAAMPAFAGSDDRPGKDWMPIEQVVKTLGDAGYSEISEVEADDGHWEGKAMKDGRLIKFHADPRTGAITKEKAASKHGD